MREKHQPFMLTATLQLLHQSPELESHPQVTLHATEFHVLLFYLHLLPVLSMVRGKHPQPHFLSKSRDGPGETVMMRMASRLLLVQCHSVMLALCFVKRTNQPPSLSSLPVGPHYQDHGESQRSSEGDYKLHACPRPSKEAPLVGPLFLTTNCYYLVSQSPTTWTVNLPLREVNASLTTIIPIALNVSVTDSVNCIYLCDRMYTISNYLQIADETFRLHKIYLSVSYMIQLCNISLHIKWIFIVLHLYTVACTHWNGMSP